MGRGRTIWGFWMLMRRAFLLIVVVGGLASEVHAHGDPVSLAYWGGFIPDAAARCQGMLGHAVVSCGLRRWNARRKCVGTEMAGKTCDQIHTDELMAAAHRHARSAVSERCDERLVPLLQFRGLYDVLVDVIDVCRAFERRITDSVYDSLVTSPLDPSSLRCVEETALVVAKLSQFAARARLRALNRIATRRGIAPADKQLLINQSRARVDRRLSVLADRLNFRCSPDGFVQLYGRTPATLLEEAGVATDCLIAGIYVQDGVVCRP